jgi:hypothetical protein
MPAMKVTISAAMRARDVSRPRPEQVAEAEASEANWEGHPWAGGSEEEGDHPEGASLAGAAADAAEGRAGRRYHARRRRRGSGGAAGSGGAGSAR